MNLPKETINLIWENLYLKLTENEISMASLNAASAIVQRLNNQPKDESNKPLTPDILHKAEQQLNVHETAPPSKPVHISGSHNLMPPTPSIAPTPTPH